MKTVITSSGNTTTAQFDKRFGRAACFCIYDEEKKETSFLNNDNVNANNGAGIKAAEKMVELGVKKVISGDFGPKAKELLTKFNIQLIIIQEDHLTIADIIEKLKH